MCFRTVCPFLSYLSSLFFSFRHVDSDQAEVRSAALDAVESCYVALGMNASRMHRLLGPVNDKTKSLVDEVHLVTLLHYWMDTGVYSEVSPMCLNGIIRIALCRET